MGQSRPLLFIFVLFLITISIILIEKSVDGMLGIWTWLEQMVGTDETTELGRHTLKNILALSTHRQSILSLWISIQL